MELPEGLPARRRRWPMDRALTRPPIEQGSLTMCGASGRNDGGTRRSRLIET